MIAISNRNSFSLGTWARDRNGKPEVRGKVCWPDLEWIARWRFAMTPNEKNICVPKGYKTKNPAFRQDFLKIQI
jgi:hypothetical protein